jgi:hypothetical protein
LTPNLKRQQVQEFNNELYRQYIQGKIEEPETVETNLFNTIGKKLLSGVPLLSNEMLKSIDKSYIGVNLSPIEKLNILLEKNAQMERGKQDYKISLNYEL